MLLALLALLVLAVARRTVDHYAPVRQRLPEGQ